MTMTTTPRERRVHKSDKDMFFIVSEDGTKGTKVKKDCFRASESQMKRSKAKNRPLILCEEPFCTGDECTKAHMIRDREYDVMWVKPHVHFAIYGLHEIPYEVHSDVKGRHFHVTYPNDSIAEPIEPERTLVTDGSMMLLEDGATSPIGVRCAHFLFMNVCLRGRNCTFIHYVEKVGRGAAQMFPEKRIVKSVECAENPDKTDVILDAHRKRWILINQEAGRNNAEETQKRAAATLPPSQPPTVPPSPSAPAPALMPQRVPPPMIHIPYARPPAYFPTQTTPCPAHLLPCHTGPCHNTVCHTAPYLTTPCHPIPCHAHGAASYGTPCAGHHHALPPCSARTAVSCPHHAPVYPLCHTSHPWQAACCGCRGTQPITPFPWASPCGAPASNLNMPFQLNAPTPNTNPMVGPSPTIWPITERGSMSAVPPPAQSNNANEQP